MFSPLTSEGINIMFEKIQEELTEIKSDGKETKAQTMRTNGRVTDLEKRESFYRGGLAVLSILLVPVCLYVVYQFINQASIDQKVQAAVSNALEQYNVEYHAN